MMKSGCFTQFLSAFLAFALVFTAVCVWSPTPAMADSVSEQVAALEKEQAALKKQIAAAKDTMADSKGTRDLYLSQVNNVQRQVDLLEGQIADLDAQTAKKNDAIAQMEAQIEKNRAEQQQVQDMLGERLCAIAKRGNLSTLQMLMDTENYTDYLLQEKLMEVVSAHDQAAIDALEQKLQEIKQAEQAIEDEKATIAEKKAEIEKLRATTDSKRKELNTLYQKANAVYKQDKREVDALNKELEQTEESIKKLLAGVNSTGVYTTMYWPVPTIRRISSTFGTRWGKLHKGIDIANGAAYGHSIVAAADGTVIFSNTSSTWGGGYGYYCMVDHGLDSSGRQIVTLYAHMSKNMATVGQKVVGGQTVLGKIGNTGNSYGAHLHFEVRVNGTPTDPLGGYVSTNGK